MEKVKTFEELVKEMGGTITPWEPSEDFIREFQEYMEKSVRESKKMEEEAWKSARDIFIH